MIDDELVYEDDPNLDAPPTDTGDDVGDPAVEVVEVEAGAVDNTVVVAPDEGAYRVIDDVTAIDGLTGDAPVGKVEFEQSAPPPPTPAEIRIAEGKRKAEEAEAARIAEAEAAEAERLAAEQAEADAIAEAERAEADAIAAEIQARSEVAKLAGYKVKAGNRHELVGYWLTRPDKSKAFYRREVRAWRGTPDYRHDATAAARDLAPHSATFHCDSESWAGELKTGSAAVIADTLAECIVELALKVDAEKRKK